jgi:hypothetical protein
MKDFEYLTEEEQYEDIININDIKRIKDPELREIRNKYWAKRHEAFLDEQNIPDWELKKVIDGIHKQEFKEIEAYKNRNKV